MKIKLAIVRITIFPLPGFDMTQVRAMTDRGPPSNFGIQCSSDYDAP